MIDGLRKLGHWSRRGHERVVMMRHMNHYGAENDFEERVIQRGSGRSLAQPHGEDGHVDGSRRDGESVRTGEGDVLSRHPLPKSVWARTG